MKKIILFLSILCLLVSCSSKSGYDPDKVSELIEEYCYETRFKNNPDEYDKMLKNLPQTTYKEIINQLHGIILEAKKELTTIKSMGTAKEQRKAYNEFINSSLLYNFKELNGLIDDAQYRHLLDDENLESYRRLQKTIENEIIPLDKSIQLSAEI